MMFSELMIAVCYNLSCCYFCGGLVLFICLIGVVIKYAIVVISIIHVKVMYAYW